jgi:hypothetical protein
VKFALAHQLRGRQSPRPPATDHPATDQQAGELVIVVFVFVFVLVFAGVLTQQLGHGQPTHPAAAHEAAAHEEAHELTIVVFVVVFIDVGFTFAFTSLTDQMGNQQPAEPAAAGDAGADQEAREMPLFAALFFDLVFVLVLILVGGRRPALLDEVGEERPANTPATRDAAGEEQLGQTVIVGAAFVFAHALVVVFLAPFPEQVGQDKPAEPAPLERLAAHEHADELALVEPAGLGAGIFGAGCSHDVSPLDVSATGWGSPVRECGR